MNFRCYDRHGLLIAKGVGRVAPSMMVVDQVAEAEVRGQFHPNLALKPFPRLETIRCDLLGVEVDASGTWAHYRELP